MTTAPTTVANLKAGGYEPDNPFHVYIGRRNRRYKVDESPFHNPYPLQHEDDRALVIERYTRYVAQQEALLAALLAGELVGCTLWCHCAPKPCHGDVLAAISNALHGEGDTPA